MRGIRFTRAGATVFMERNKYAPWGRGYRVVTKPTRAPYVWRKGNGRLDAQ